MAKLVGVLILALLLLIFSSQNLHPVWIRFITGPPVQMPLIVVIVGSVIVGFAIATFNHIIRATRQSKKKEDQEE
jgi:uncharacterized integral membrane protein